MSDCMTFPDDWREFLRDYSFKDTDEVYTNGAELIPVFRVEQLIEHLLKEQEPRVLTIEEVKAYPTDKALWFEGWMIAPVLPDCRVEQQNEDKLGVEVVDRLYDFPLWYDSYNVDFKYGWRCWSARPTDELRRAVKWDD